MAARATLAALAAAAACASVGACGDSTESAELVVRDARLGGAAPRVLGATGATVFWSASPATGATLVGAGALTALPTPGSQIATASGPLAHGGEYVVFAADGLISRVDGAGEVLRVSTGLPQSLAASSADPPVVAWSEGPVVKWGISTAQGTATPTRIDRCDHLRVTSRYVHVAADGGSGRRLLRIDQQTAEVTPVTPSSTWAPMFPGGGITSSTYVGRIVDADDDGALWLVEEMPSRRGILVLAPVQGEPTVLLQHLRSASGVFATPTALYWQEDDALLTAPRTGGPAAIVATLPGSAGAIADGYVYFTNGNAIERLPVE